MYLSYEINENGMEMAIGSKRQRSKTTHGSKLIICQSLDDFVIHLKLANALIICFFKKAIRQAVYGKM